MKFSIIIPSYNQPDFIEETIKNTLELRRAAAENGDSLEILIFDSESPEPVQDIIRKYQPQLDVVEIRKDDGQYDAINRGIQKCTGDYWTWLNTDDTIDVTGFQRLSSILKSDPSIDYIYGSIDHIDTTGKVTRSFPAYPIDFRTMVTRIPGIFQQGSFFRKSFTDKIGLLKKFDCCFDYEYVLRCLAHHAKVRMCDFKVANFRQHSVSKTGSRTPVFIREQLQISKAYGRRLHNHLSWFSQLRLLKHRIFPR